MFSSLKSNKAFNAIRGLGWQNMAAIGIGVGAVGVFAFGNRISPEERNARLKQWYDETHNQATNAALSLRNANPNHPMWRQ